MDWFGAGGNGPLIVVRAIHFAATSITAGSLIFATLVARPVLRSEEAEAREQTRWVAGIGLAIAAASGVIWFLFQAVSMSGLPLDEAMKSSVLSTVLNQTQFGQVSEIRIGLAIVVAACLACHRLPMADWLGLAAALGLTIGLAWTGHAGSTLGDMGILHLTADGLHLIAAAAWIGGLVSLVLLLARVRRNRTVASASLARHAVGRFSALGIVSVATLLATGTVNAWILVGSFHALVGTEYGRLLTIKMVAFAVMLAFAAFNRLWLTPRLVLSSGNELWPAALHQLARNSTIEIALGFVIFAIVGLLGTLHPAIHLL
jgi:putative copper resistance protein D